MTSKKLTLGMTTAFLVAMGGTYVVLNSTALNAWTAQVTSTDTLHSGGIVEPYTSPQPIPVTTPVQVPQPQVITKEIPGPERIVEKIVNVPGPERIVEKIVTVPGPERIVEKIVPGPECIVEKIVPGPERIVVKEVRVPYPSKGGDLASSGFDLWTIFLLTGSLSCGVAARKMYMKKQQG